MTARMILVLVTTTALAFGLTSVIHVDPVKTAWSGLTDTLPPSNFVSEVLTLNVDSLGTPGYCELFSGQGGPEAFNLTVLTYPGGYPLANGQGTGLANCIWVRCTLTVTHPESLVKGKRYEFHWSRASGARIQYYYNYCATRYDSMIVPGEDQPPPQPLRPALAMRCLGRLNPLDATLFGATAILPWEVRSTWASRAREAGLGWATTFFDWDRIEKDSAGSYDWYVDDEIRCLSESASLGRRVLGVLRMSPAWASSRPVKDTVPDKDTFLYCSILAAPRNLWATPDTGDTNLLANYLRALLQHSDTAGRPCDNIHVWECLNEVNEGCTLDYDPNRYPGYTGWWRRPRLQYTNDGSLEQMSALYMKYASVAAGVIRSCSLHANDTILIGSLGRVDYEKDTYRLYKGREWLEACYQAAQDSNYGIFWNGVSVHPYHYGSFSPDSLEEHSRMLREIMRQHGDYGELWSTEFGWTRTGEVVASRHTAANVLAETYVATEGSKALAQGGLDRMCWWVFYYPDSSFGNEPLLDPDMERLPAFYAFKQMTQTLTGKRFNGRVMTGDAWKDSAVRMYEFENPATLKRTWVCWKNGGAGSGGLSVKLPVRTDSLTAESLAYSATPSPFSAPVAPDGWLSLSLNERPAFVTEVTDTLRPDLRVDSVRYSPSPGPMYVKAWVTNHGSRATPRSPSGTQSYPTWAVLSRNGDSLAQQVYTDSIAVGHQVEFKFTLTSPPPDSTLFSVRVNPLHAYVELGTDDNTGHSLAVKP